jgi:hypothetical protein
MESTIVKEGWLYKQSKFFKTWRKYAHNAGDGASSTTQTYSHTRNARNMSIPPKKYPSHHLKASNPPTKKWAKNSHLYSITQRIETKDRAFNMQSETNVEKESWIGALGIHLFRKSND